MSSPAPLGPSRRRPLPSSSLHPPTHARTQNRSGSGTATPTTGSATQTLTSTSPRNSESPEPPLVLRLRGAHSPSTRTETDEAEGSRRTIRWAEDVVNNEGLGRKSSKVCCIYHRPKAVGESDTESDSSSSSSESDSDDSGSLDDRARPAGGKRGSDCGHDGHKHTSGKRKRGRRRPSPNAYERLPKHQREAQEKT